MRWKMIMTYDWMVYAQHHPAFKKEIEAAIESGKRCELTFRQIHRIQFDPEERSVTVTPYSDNSEWRCKIIPIRIKYKAVLKAINGDWEHFSEDDIQDME